jgi:hypothetical protein
MYHRCADSVARGFWIRLASEAAVSNEIAGLIEHICHPGDIRRYDSWKGLEKVVVTGRDADQ